MATTWALMKSTPYSACYELDGGAVEGPGVLDYSNAGTFNALVPGPYKYFIRKHLGNLDALNLSALGGTGPRRQRIRIYQVSGAPGAEGGSAAVQPYTLTWIANGLTATLAGGENRTIRRIEIRFVHSSRR